MAFFNLPTLVLLCFLIAPGIRPAKCTKFTIINNCNETIWPAVTPNNFSGGGFALKPNQSAVFTAPPAWHGRIWARTACSFHGNGTGTCQTGGCGNLLQCRGADSPPASIAKFSLGDIDYYDVSLVNGFNLPIIVQPFGGKGNCSTAGCDTDLLPSCPPELALKYNGRIIACRSACDVFNKDEYCCRGEFNTPAACLATDYSRIFKTACPAASSFAYDNLSSIINCTDSVTDYMVSFCSSRNQTECTYHDNKLMCNGAIGMMKQVWKKLLIAIAVAISIPVFMWLKNLFIF